MADKDTLRKRVKRLEEECAALRFAATTAAAAERQATVTFLREREHHELANALDRSEHRRTR